MFGANPYATEIKLIDLKLPSQWRAFDAPLTHTHRLMGRQDVVNGAHRYSRQGGAFGGCQTQRKVTNNLAKLCLAVFRASEISILKIMPRS